MQSQIKQPDFLFLIDAFFLLGIGLVMILSTSTVVGLQAHNDAYFYLKKHLFNLFIGFGLFLFGLSYDYRNYRRFTFWGLVISAGLLLATYIPGLGVTAGGATRWLDIGFYRFQPSEIAKFFVIIFVARAAAVQQENIKNFFTGILPVLMIVGFIALLILKQPSLGSTVIMLGTTCAMLFVAGANLWQMLILGLVGFRFTAWWVLQNNYQKQRWLAFLDPWKNYYGIGFHTVQSLLAIGSGGFFGVGLGNSKQKFNYLPQQYTDFIFSILCEEGGMLFGLIVVGLFAMLIWRGLRIAARARERFGQLLAAGCIFSIGLQAVTNYYGNDRAQSDDRCSASVHFIWRNKPYSQYVYAWGSSSNFS
jgi:cell division protein FtsW